MSSLNELITEYCPDGVLYKNLSEVVSIERGKRVVKEQLSSDGLYPVYQNSLIPLGFFDKSNYKSHTTFIIVAGAAGEIGYSETDFWAADDCFPLICNNNILDRYLYHCVLNLKPTIMKRVRKASIPRLSRASIETLRIPYPPLPIQEEIVRILDEYTELNAKLATELTAELVTRKKQYEFYADDLISSIPDITEDRWVTIADTIISLKTGLNPRQNFKLNVGGERPYITGKDINNNSVIVSDKTDMITDDVVCLINRRASLQANDVLFASTGTGTVGRMAVIDEYNNDWAVSETMYCLKPKLNIIDPYYLMYSLYAKSSREQFEPKISKGSVPHLKVNDLLNVRIPVPSIKEQKHIIEIMKNFDNLLKDITHVLQAEIAARQKQYEYYRDKLLTFPELKESEA